MFRYSRRRFGCRVRRVVRVGIPIPEHEQFIGFGKNRCVYIIVWYWCIVLIAYHSTIIVLTFFFFSSVTDSNSINRMLSSSNQPGTGKNSYLLNIRCTVTQSVRGRQRQPLIGGCNFWSFDCVRYKPRKSFFLFLRPYL